MKKYLKSYTAITTGSMAGRDDGYPYTAYQVLDSIEDVARYHGKRSDEQYFEIHAVDETEFLKAIEKAKDEINEKNRMAERERKQQEILRLQEELREEEV